MKWVEKAYEGECIRIERGSLLTGSPTPNVNQWKEATERFLKWCFFDLLKISPKKRPIIVCQKPF